MTNENEIIWMSFTVDITLMLDDQDTVQSNYCSGKLLNSNLGIFQYADLPNNEITKFDSSDIKKIKSKNVDSNIIKGYFEIEENENGEESGNIIFMFFGYQMTGFFYPNKNKKSYNNYIYNGIANLNDEHNNEIICDLKIEKTSENDINVQLIFSYPVNDDNFLKISSNGKFFDLKLAKIENQYVNGYLNTNKNACDFGGEIEFYYLGKKYFGNYETNFIKDSQVEYFEDGIKKIKEYKYYSGTAILNDNIQATINFITDL